MRNNSQVWSVRTRGIQLLFFSLLSFVTACGSDLATLSAPRQGNGENDYWSLSLNYKAITLALVSPYDTVRLHVTPRDARGDPIDAQGGIPTYSYVDSTSIRVASDGMVSAIAVGTAVRVIVRMQIGNLTHMDTALIDIKAAPPSSPLQAFSIQPAATDSTKWTYGGEPKIITPTVKSAANSNIRGLRVSWSSSNPTVATIAASGTTNGELTGRSQGTTKLFAHMYAYGVYREDTVTYTVGLPVTQLIDVIRISDARGMTTGITFAPNVVTLAIGGTVSWRYYQNGWGTDGGPGITFEKPEAASPGDELIPALPWTGGGNIPTVPYCFSSPIVPESLCWPALEGSFVRIRPSRKFLAADTIIYHDELGRSTGTIIVK